MYCAGILKELLFCRIEGNFFGILWLDATLNFLLCPSSGLNTLADLLVELIVDEDEDEDVIRSVVSFFSGSAVIVGFGGKPWSLALCTGVVDMDINRTSRWKKESLQIL